MIEKSKVLAMAFMKMQGPSSSLNCEEKNRADVVVFADILMSLPSTTGPCVRPMLPRTHRTLPPCRNHRHDAQPQVWSRQTSCSASLSLERNAKRIW